MKKNILRLFFVLLVFVLIMTMVANPTKASQDTPEGGQIYGDEIDLLPYQLIDEANILDRDDNYEISFGEEKPADTQAASKSWVSFPADNFIPWNYTFYPSYKRADNGCQAIFISDTSYEGRYGATIPLSIPVGSTITYMGFSGVDNFSGEGRNIHYSIRRAHYKGDRFEVVKQIGTTDAYTNPQPVWVSASLDHTVQTGWSYYLYIETYATWGEYSDIHKLKICLMEVDYIPQSPFALAIPTVIK